MAGHVHHLEDRRARATQQFPALFNHLVGAGKQGVAAACDVIRFGFAARVTIADASVRFAREAAAVAPQRRVSTGRRSPPADAPGRAPYHGHVR